jgi:hypothetical protein
MEFLHVYSLCRCLEHHFDAPEHHRVGAWSITPWCLEHHLPTAEAMLPSITC